MEWKCFPRDNTVLFHHNIRRLSPLFTLRRSILTAMMPGSLLFICLVSSLREIGFMMFDRFWFYDVRQILDLWNGNASHATILFSSIITSTVHLHSLRFAGLFLRPTDAYESLLLPFWFFLSERLNWGLLPHTQHYGFILFRHNIHTLYD